MKKNFLLIFCAFLLTACGFHLRGHQPMPAELKTMHLETNAPYSTFSKQLQQTLKGSGITLVEANQAAPVTLQILSDAFSSTSSSVGANGQVTTYVLNYTIIFQLKDRNNKIIAGPMTVNTTRNYSVSANQVVGDTNVQNNLQEDMRRDAIFQIMNRLRSRNVLRALNQLATS